MYDIYHEILAFISKWSTYIVATFIGVVGKISYEIGMKRKMSLMQWFAVVGVSIFVGYLVSIWCINNGWDHEAGYLVPSGTLLGEKILIYVSNNYKNIFTKLIGLFTKGKK